jgi:taurine dioxygenase
MRFIPQAGFLGATVDEVVLHSLSAAEVVALRRGLAEHQVLFFRNQPLTPEKHRQLALLLGTLHSHPAHPTADGFPEVTILHHDQNTPTKIDTWHTDMTFMADPPEVSILQALEVPERGGDTLFSSCGAAWDHLSERFAQFLAPLKAVHDFRYGFRQSLAEPGGAARLADALATFPAVRHPVMQRHP